MLTDKRLVFDTIPEQFDKWRHRYSAELFDFIVKTCALDKTKSCLEIGPGTGQASDFAINSGADYTAIELGKNFTQVMKEKYGAHKNFHIINADFEKHDFAPASFDLVYSAATIQWIKEDLAYKKCYDMLKAGGFLAMFRLRDDYKTPNPELYSEIQKVYDEYFEPEQPYTCKFNYKGGTAYGFEYLGEHNFYGSRTYTADEYVEYMKTHSDHITIKAEKRDSFFGGIHEAVLRHGNKIVFNATYVLDLYRK